MENYEVLKQLGVGVQGCTYLVKHTTLNQLYALKMVECLDESHAHNALKEYTEMQKVGRHRLICDVEEFFIHRDNQLSTVFFCIISIYYPRGNLGTFLTMQNPESKTPSESTIQNWLSEIIEALLYVNKKQICHGDLKPSNVYLQDNGNHIVVGDFCVPSILSDIKTHTRCPLHSQHWWAPELTNRTDSNSLGDVWSVGCILLQMMLARVHASDDFYQQLDDVKFSRTGLEEMLQPTQEIFSAQLQSLVRIMLSIDPSHRPTLSDLAEIKLVVDSMTEADASRIADQQIEFPPKPLPSTENIVAYMKHILDNLGNELCLADAFQHLLTIIQSTSSPLILDGPKKKIIVKAMNLHLANECLFSLGLELLLSQLVTHVDANDYLFSPQSLEVIIGGMKRHVTSPAVQNSVAKLLTAAVIGESAIETMQNVKVYVDLLATMRQFANNAPVLTSCMNALWSLMAVAGNVHYLAKQKAVIDVVNAMKCHATDANLLQSAMCMILGLTLQDENMRLIKSTNCVQAIIEALERFCDVPVLAKYACLTLAAIVEADEEMAYLMLSISPNKQTSGIDVILKVYSNHRLSVDVVNAVCMLLIELSHYEDIASELEFMKVDENVLKPIRKTFKDDSELLRKSNTVAANMRSVKPLFGKKGTLS